jgi:hypothetical protein
MVPFNLLFGGVNGVLICILLSIPHIGYNKKKGDRKAGEEAK